mgnify:CR=1 FL=1
MNNPFFSIVIPSRNRISLFKRAMESVESQQTQSKFDVEIIVVNDGSEHGQLSEYRAVIEQAEFRATMLELPARENGHGPGFARNTGAAYASGQFLCFLDDDDEWTDPQHLLKSWLHLTQNPNHYSLLLTNQIAVDINNIQQAGPIWTEDLIDKQAEQVIRELSLTTLMQSQGFTHLNCLICSKPLYEAVRGYDEALRYEGDRDLFIRLASVAEHIYFSNDTVAKHYIPDPSKTVNTSTKVNALQKLQYQIYSNQKLLILLKHPAVINKCLQHLTYSYKKAAELLAQDKQYQLAYRYAKYALATRFNSKWFLFCLYLACRRII